MCTDRTEPTASELRLFAARCCCRVSGLLDLEAPKILVLEQFASLAQYLSKLYLADPQELLAEGLKLREKTRAADASDAPDVPEYPGDGLPCFSDN